MGPQVARRSSDQGRRGVAYRANGQPLSDTGRHFRSATHSRNQPGAAEFMQVLLGIVLKPKASRLTASTRTSGLLQNLFASGVSICEMAQL